MPNLIFIVNPCPPMPPTNPALGIDLSVSCASNPTFQDFKAIPYAFTLSGPTPSNSLILWSLVESGTEYADLCNCLRNGTQVQITLQYQLVGPFIVVNKVSSQVLADSQPVSTQLMEIHESTARIERDLSGPVRNDLNLLKAQMVQVLARLPPLAHSGSPQHVSGFPTSAESGEDPERVLFGTDDAQ